MEDLTSLFLMKTKVLVIRYSESTGGSQTYQSKDDCLQEKLDKALEPYQDWEVKSATTHSCVKSLALGSVFYTTTIVLQK